MHWCALLRVTKGAAQRHLTRGGHKYTRCTDTRDRDQILIEPIIGP